MLQDLQSPVFTALGWCVLTPSLAQCFRAEVCDWKESETETGEKMQAHPGPRVTLENSLKGQ